MNPVVGKPAFSDAVKNNLSVEHQFSILLIRSRSAAVIYHYQIRQIVHRLAPESDDPDSSYK